jgi:hypothetical protein
MSFAQQATGLSNSATAVYNVMKSHGAKIFNASTGFMTNISTPIFNKMSSWNTDKIFFVVKVGLTILIGIFGIIKVTEWINNTIKEASFIADLLSLDMASPSKIDKLQKLAVDISPKYEEGLKEQLINKYEEDYKQYITKNRPNIINAINQLRREVGDSNYTFQTNDDLIKHNILQEKKLNGPYLTEEENPQYYLNKSVDQIPGLNWDKYGLRHTALTNLTLIQ